MTSLRTRAPRGMASPCTALWPSPSHRSCALCLQMARTALTEEYFEKLQREGRQALGQLNRSLLEVAVIKFSLVTAGE